MSKTRTGLAVILLTAIHCPAVLEAGARKVPPHIAFWQAPPKRDPVTVFLWHFDEESEEPSEGIAEDLAGEDPFGEEEETETPLGDPAGGPTSGLASIPEPSRKLSGDARLVGRGRFGGGVGLSGKGAILAGELGWQALLKKESITLELWCRPEDTQGSDHQILLTIPGASSRVRSLLLHRERHGKLVVALGRQPLLEHEHRAPSGSWTHIVFMMARNGEFALLVNGHPAVYEEASDGPIATRFRPYIGERLVLGASPSLKHGFAGLIDEVRLSRGERHFYKLADHSFCDVDKQRPFFHESPYFVRKAFHVYCGFDGALKPEVFHGHAVHAEPVKQAFVPGVRGQALDLAKMDEEKFALRGRSVLPGKQGTLELWFRPKRWNNFFVGKDYFGKDVKGFNLVRFAHRGAARQLNLKALRILTGIKAMDAPSGKRIVRFHPGRWTHVVVTWGGGRRPGVYLDGEPQEIGQVALAHGGHPHIKKAVEEWRKRTGGKDDGTFALTFPKSGTLVDELRIYPYAFAAEEAWNAYARCFPDYQERLRKLPFVRAEFGYVAHSWHMIERLNVSLACLPVKEVEPATVAMKIFAEGQDEPFHVEDEVKLDENGRGKVAIKKHFDFGHYPIDVTSKSKDGETLMTHRVEYVREKPPWWKNRLGRDRSVPPPWTPIEIDGDTTLRVWGRTLELDKTGLPASITAIGRELLAAPVRVHGTVNGAAVELAGQGVELIEKAEDRVRWSGRLAGGPLAAKVETWMEYDGLMYYTVTLGAAKGGAANAVTVEKLAVDFPMRTAEATQYICNSGGFNFRASWDVGFIPKGEGSVWSTLKPRRRMHKAFGLGNYCPNIWVGGDHCGLNFSGDNDQGWTPDNAAAAQELVREGDAVLYRMNVITKPVAIEKSRTFTFIIIATPTKPMAKGWRGWNRSGRGVPYAVVDGIDKFLGHSLTADPRSAGPGQLSFEIEPHDWDTARTQSEGLREKIGPGSPRLLYIDYSWPKFGPTIADWNHDLHAGTGRLAWTPEVEDYFVWVINEYIRRGLIEGLYIDDTSMGRTFSLASTAYPFPEVKERRRVGFNSMGFRRFLQRCYKCCYAQGTTPYLSPHMTYCFEMPALSFCAATVNGEARDIHPFTKRDAISTWSRTELRVMGNGPKWGFATFWKPCIQKTELVKDKAALRGWLHPQARAMHALIPQHDIWYYWHWPSANCIIPSFLAFGMEDPDLRFVPYWEMEGTASVTGGKEGQILLGLWVRKGRALMMISNLDRQEHTVTVTVVPADLFGRPVGGLAWKDVDCSLERPEDLTAMARGKGVPKAAVVAENILDDGEEDPTEQEVADEMEDTNPKKREQQRLAPRPSGNEVTIVVRARDYRLLEISSK